MKHILEFYWPGCVVKMAYPLSTAYPLFKINFISIILNLLLSGAYLGILLARMCCQNGVSLVSSVLSLLKFNIYQSVFDLLLYGAYLGILLARVCCKIGVSLDYSAFFLLKFTIYRSVCMTITKQKTVQP